jgi:hypothetical protein
LAASFFATRRIYELDFVARTISSAGEGVLQLSDIQGRTVKRSGYMRAKPERGVFAVPFIRMDHPLAPSSSLVELLSKIPAGHTLLGDDESG